MKWKKGVTIRKKNQNYSLKLSDLQKNVDVKDNYLVEALKKRDGKE